LRIGLGLVLLFSVLLLIDAIIGPLLWLTLGLLWCTTSSLGLVMANATALAIEEAQGAGGTGSAILGALQAGVGAIVSPIVRVAGTATMVPMAIAMLGSAVIAAGATALTRPG
jgi:DHA1 family bicyclomycin/chloramphenicol resistance-like MFS transporter